jgi:hypothetical protein
MIFICFLYLLILHVVLFFILSYKWKNSSHLVNCIEIKVAFIHSYAVYFKKKALVVNQKLHKS